VNQAARHGYRGYVTSRPFGKYAIPVPVQSLVLRDYCAHNKLFFILPVNENIFPNSFMVLEGLIRDLSAYEGIVMCSMHMLPTRVEARKAVVERVLSQGCSMHFALEATVVSTPKDLARIEELLTLSRAAAGQNQLRTLRAALAAPENSLSE
jgi:sporadic carbohydrate cluster protein (TIGR04323 family)